MKIFIFGLTASGKSRQALAMASCLKYQYISATDKLLNITGININPESHFWLEEDGRRINQMRDEKPIDYLLDRQLLDLVSNSNDVVTDSWALPWLYDGSDAVRIYLKPSLSSRAIMAFYSRERKKYSVAELIPMIDEKDKYTREKFLKLYDFDIFDTSRFDLVLDNFILAPFQTTSLLCSYITQRILSHRTKNDA